MKGSNIAIIAALAAGLYLLSKSNGGQGLQSVFDNLSNWLGGSPSGSGTNTPVLNSGTAAGVLDKNSVPPSSNPAIIAQVNQISTYQVGVATNAANALVTSGAWTPATAAASIANATQENANYWQSKGF
jgi:hypothetical protein